MKNQHACPKCTGRKIWVVEPFRLPDDTLDGRPVHVVPHQSEGGAGFFKVESAKPRGELDLYVCDDCGYSELWARNVKNLRETRTVRLLDSSGNRAGPFR